MVEGYLAGKIKIDEFITAANEPLERINEAFELMKKPVGHKWVRVLEIIFKLTFITYFVFVMLKRDEISIKYFLIGSNHYYT